MSSNQASANSAVETAAAAPPTGRLGLASWCLYDWANSAFSSVVTTFVFVIYFTQVVASSPTEGTAQLGFTLGVCGLLIAILSPMLGAIGDHTGRRKPWLALFTLLCAASTGLLWFVQPSPGFTRWGLGLFALATLGFEFATVFYNAMLPEVAPEGYLGRVSGWGWALGYAGGLICLVIALLAFVQASPPPFGLDPGRAEHLRATNLLVAVWFVVFSLPLFLFTPDRRSSGMPLWAALRNGCRALVSTLRQVRRYGTIVWFLLAHMFYADGLVTLFAFGGVYAAGTFGMEFDEVIWFGIALNVTAGLGAAAFAGFDDRFGSRLTILISLACLIALAMVGVLTQSKQVFWICGAGLGVFVGPAQAASRSLMARLSPPELRTEMFGLYALSGKATAFLGPMLLGQATEAFDSQRAGMAVIVGFLVVGLLLLLRVRRD